MSKIRLTGKYGKGKYAIVDDGDFEWLNQWKWYLHTGYPARKPNGNMIFMHRLINKTPKGMNTDHINRNPLDNRRNNLRNADKSLNGHNRGAQTNNTSGYKGVHFHTASGLWVAQIKCREKRIVKYFNNIIDAVYCRKLLEKEIYV